MKRAIRNRRLYFSFEKEDWYNSWAKRVMNITKSIPEKRYNHRTKEWSIPLEHEDSWRDKIDAESVVYWTDEEYQIWAEEAFGAE